ncbi:MAG TPA: amidophosphoribosyltransferase [Candidatus Syntrophoarchaeum butanivorans]|uniref:Amidophosphoribosyltransferase n=2 Tax=Candidatus Syntropharchaeum butanivorans TaxID=1839936 RepID=A0A1F2P5E5_9EURY|nr:MAG: amidophosphoribosyltransferase [Candidatus Syntrophoarchaeum butanivorans]HEC56569.1 amidophosphoribosyltransferase [Candidatus Syntrophoarchaeum butanivorans]
MKDECGVAGIALDGGSVSYRLFLALYALQHRGQESAGIATWDGNSIRSFKEMGLVSEVFNEGVLEWLGGRIGIGHVRYSTSGGSFPENSQPFTVKFKDGMLAIAHNGNLINTGKLRRHLEKLGATFVSTTDTEVIAYLLVKELLRRDPVDAIRAVMRQLEGSYSLTILINDILIGVRDPLGIKPLVLGKLEDGYIIASESVAIDVLDGELIRDVEPGELVMIKDGEPETYRLVRREGTAHCVFEYIYFARPDSLMNGHLVYDIRKRIGEKLFIEHPVDGDLVSPVPDSGVTFAIGYAAASGIPYLEGLIKNRYLGRTFIMPHQEMREVSVRLKLNVVRPNVENKRVILVDDSIVRGTTSRRIVDYLRSGGAREVHMRIGSPPIIAPCYLGINMSTRDELIASNRSVDQIRDALNLDSIGYISIDGLIEAVGERGEDLCLGCLTGIYPLEIPGERCIVRQMKLTQF